MRLLLITQDLDVGGPSVSQLPDFQVHAVAFNQLDFDQIVWENYEIVVVVLPAEYLKPLTALIPMRPPKLPIVLMASDVDRPSRISALRLGVADYIDGCVDSEELGARLRSVVRRSKGHSGPEIRSGSISLNLETGMVHVDGAPVYLTRRERQILNMLALYQGTPVSGVALSQVLYGLDQVSESRAIRYHIFALRKKLRFGGRSKFYIENEIGRGYILP